MYKIGSRLVEIKKAILDKIREWSIPPFGTNLKMDRKVVAALLIACVGVQKLANSDIADGVMDFIECKYRPTEKDIDSFPIESFH